MKNEGWTLSDLMGELMVRGIDIDNVSDYEIQRVLDYSRPEWAADEILKRF
ncbi:MAG: hypothetical protein WDA59_00065 [Methanofastidiosum sp.]|jgi:hypothetical protein